jgi:sensor domain CHASE-containing protein
MMKPSLYKLMIVSPGDPQVLKFQVSRRMIMILIAAFLLSFLVTVAVGYTISRRGLSSAEHTRLQEENQTLEVENRNIAIRYQKLEAQLDDIEKRSQRVSSLLKETN